MSNTDWTMLLPFSIDSGELDGMTPQRAFTLGFEFSRAMDMIFRASPKASPFTDSQPSMTIHADNEERVRQVANRHQIPIKVHCFHDDWRELVAVQSDSR